MANIENRINGIKFECNVLSSFLKPMKRAKRKNSHYSPILQSCMSTHSRRAKFKNFQILLDSGNSSTILIGRLTSKLKTKESDKLCRKPKPRISPPQRR